MDLKWRLCEGELCVAHLPKMATRNPPSDIRICPEHASHSWSAANTRKKLRMEVGNGKTKIERLLGSADLIQYTMDFVRSTGRLNNDK